MDNKRDLTKHTFVKGILNYFEDPRYPSIGPHIRFLSFIGQWTPNPKTLITRLKRVHYYITFAFFFSIYIKCLMILDSKCILGILHYAPFHIGLIKVGFFRKDYKLWEKLIEFMSTTELSQIAKGQYDVVETIGFYIMRSRRITYFFWILAFFSNFSIFCEPYQKNHGIENGTVADYVKLFNGMTPFDQSVPAGYYASMAIETIYGYTVSVYIITWDALVVSIMIFFAGQLKISRIHCTHIIDVDSVERSQQNIAECHRFHTTLVMYHQLFNSLISPLMFIYLVVICVNLGVCIIQMVQIMDDVPALVASALYINACLTQLLLFYWYSNEVTIESLEVRDGIFESDWVNMDAKLRKDIVLLQFTTGKRLVFYAGPFNEMSLNTFLGILRGSYSFFTLLNKTN